MMVSKATLVELQDISHLEIACHNSSCGGVELVPISGNSLFPESCPQCGTPFFPNRIYEQLLEGKLLAALRALVHFEAKEPRPFSLRLRLPTD